MVTFEMTLSDTWQEVLQGATRLFFDGLSASTAYVYFSETADNPGTSEGSPVYSWPSDWDFGAVGMTSANQRIWVKGSGSIRGVRG